MIKVSDYIIQRLAEVYKVNQVFMIPGGGAMHLNDALAKYQDRIHYLCNHHEQACAIAAEGYARVSGKLGVVVVTTGPGGLNTLTGVMGQWTDSVPTLYISGQVKQETTIHACPELHLRQLGDQEVDIISVVKPLTKFAVSIDHPKKVKKLLDEAIFQALSGRPGPVWLDVPMDIQGALIDEKDLEEFTPSIEKVADFSVYANELKKLIAQAKRPVLIPGNGVRVAGAHEELLQLGEVLKVPIISTFSGVDMIASDNPYYIGRFGTIGSRAGNFALQNADLVICIGTRNNIRQISYNWKTFAREAKIIVVDIDEAELKKPTIKPSLPVCMDAKRFIEAFIELLQTENIPDWSDWLNWCIERKLKYPPVLLEWKETKDGIQPYVFMEALSKIIPSDAITVTGNGTACVAAYQAVEVREHQRYIWNSGCASMGYDLPAAIGASVAAPSKDVFCLAGDGSIMMNLQELETVIFHQLPIKIFILNNDGYVSMKQTQDNFFEGRHIASDPRSGLGLPDFVKLGEAMGFKTFTLTDQQTLETDLQAIVQIKGPVLCEVKLSDYIFSPKSSSEKKADGRMVSKPLEDLAPFLPREEFLQNMIIKPVAED